jgi:Amidohydrolase family
MVAGKTVGGTPLYPEANRLDRAEALRRYTLGSAWFSGDEDRKGAIAPGHLADLAVLSADYFAVPAEDIKGIESLLTLVGGKVVYAAGDFAGLAPPPLPVVPEWSPVKFYGGYRQPHTEAPGAAGAHACARAGWLHGLLHRLASRGRQVSGGPLWGLGCECFAF